MSLLSSPEFSSPLVAGIFHARIVFPKSLIESSSTDDLEPLILHELAHVRRYDCFANWVQVVLQIVHWYNPFVWIANRQIRREREQACDDRVLVATGLKRKEYGSSLVKVLETAPRRQVLSLGLVGVAESWDSLKRRLSRIMDTKRIISTRLSVPALLLVCLLAAMLLPAQPRAVTVRDSAEQESSAAPGPRAFETGMKQQATVHDKQQPQSAAPETVAADHVSSPAVPGSDEARKKAIEEARALGQRHYDKGEYEKAIAEWERVLLVDPTNQLAKNAIREATIRSIKKQRERPRAGEHALSDPESDAAIQSVLGKIEATEKKLEAPVTVDFLAGTDISDILIFLSDCTSVNIVLDERVMLPPALPALPKGGAFSGRPKTQGATITDDVYFRKVDGASSGRPKAEGATSPDLLGVVKEIVGADVAPAKTEGAAPSKSGEGLIRATVKRETSRVYLKNLPLSQALRGSLVPMGLDYTVQPDFVWISRPEVLQTETFEPLYTRAFRLQHIRADVVIPKLRAAVPDITERYTGRTLSYVESAGANGNVLAIHQTPSNLKRIEELLKVLDLPG